MGPGKKCIKKTQKEAFRMKGALWNVKRSKTTNNSWAQEGQRKSQKMNRSNRKEALWKPLWEEQSYKMLRRTTTKALRRRVLIEECLAKSSKKQRTQTCGIFVKQVVFHTVNHRGPLPLKELHSTGETIVWRDPGGSWACLQVQSPCHSLWHMWNTPQTAH